MNNSTYLAQWQALFNESALFFYPESDSYLVKLFRHLPQSSPSAEVDLQRGRTGQYDISACARGDPSPSPLALPEPTVP